jgi:hypothetical protein
VSDEPRAGGRNPSDGLDGGTASSSRPPCWGIGLGRTGTTSFCEALRLLGYARVAHNPVFEALRGLEGGADIGVYMNDKYLDYKFPKSKFVLTFRDLPSWLDSKAAIADLYPVRSRDEDIAILRRMTVYETVGFDRQKMTAAYHRHHDDVRRYFADRPEDLLELNILQGEAWERLCPFLGLPVPTVRFPNLNRRG